jgi:hypothetical protein
MLSRVCNMAPRTRIFASLPLLSRENMCTQKDGGGRRADGKHARLLWKATGHAEVVLLHSQREMHQAKTAIERQGLRFSILQTFLQLSACFLAAFLYNLFYLISPLFELWGWCQL